MSEFGDMGGDTGRVEGLREVLEMAYLGDYQHSGNPMLDIYLTLENLENIKNVENFKESAENLDIYEIHSWEKKFINSEAVTEFDYGDDGFIDYSSLGYGENIAEEGKIIDGQTEFGEDSVHGIEVNSETLGDLVFEDNDGEFQISNKKSEESFIELGVEGEPLDSVYGEVDPLTNIPGFAAWDEYIALDFENEEILSEFGIGNGETGVYPWESDYKIWDTSIGGDLVKSIGKQIGRFSESDVPLQGYTGPLEGGIANIEGLGDTRLPLLFMANGALVDIQSKNVLGTDQNTLGVKSTDLSNTSGNDTSTLGVSSNVFGDIGVIELEDDKDIRWKYLNFTESNSNVTEKTNIPVEGGWDRLKKTINFMLDGRVIFYEKFDKNTALLEKYTGIGGLLADGKSNEVGTSTNKVSFRAEVPSEYLEAVGLGLASYGLFSGFTDIPEIFDITEYITANDMFQKYATENPLLEEKEHYELLGFS